MEKARGMLTTNPSPPKVLLEEGGPCTIRCAHSEARKPRGASHSISQPAGAEGPALRRRVSSDEFQRVSNSSFPCLQNEEIVVRRPRGKPVAGDSSHRDIGAEAKQRERGRGNPASICFCLYRVSVWPASPGAEDGRYRFCWIPFAPDAVARSTACMSPPCGLGARGRGERRGRGRSRLCPLGVWSLRTTLDTQQVASDSGDVSLYPPGERRLRCFQSLAVMDKASTNAQSF
ncbi:uncharacterized protein LOC112650436 isoform X4 [Canis lupus dingo]|uniref:uncharacterized protein LOC112650436 isoform X4 n=1 Tax=Canis lupus dingo TaxID=286419 RepID=UPI0015F14B16|nr:uncharacterized protein LOC112650436 isoform X4 [Canis lupus dingo]